jgi:hypothetical protein
LIVPAPVLSTLLRHAGSGVAEGPVVAVGDGVVVVVGESVAVGPLTTIVKTF